MRQDNLSNTFAALADPTRRAILARLASGETSVTELAQPFEMSLPADDAGHDDGRSTTLARRTAKVCAVARPEIFPARFVERGSIGR